MKEKTAEKDNKNKAEKGIRKAALFSAGALILVGIWYLAAFLANRDLLLKIPYFHETVAVFFKNLGSAKFLKAVFSSMLNVILGFAAGAILGVVFGVLSGISSVFKELTMPLKLIIKSVPVAAFIIVAWLWIPSAALPGFISSVMVLPIVWSHTDAGLCTFDKRYDDLSKAYGLSKAGALFRVKIPFIIPQIRTGCITAIGIAWKAGVAAEVISTPNGTVGALLRDAKSGVELTEVFAIALGIIILSLIFENVLKIIWREQRR